MGMKEAAVSWLAVAIAAVWGSSFLLMQSVVDEIGPSAYIFLRFFLAFLVLIGVFGKTICSLKRDTILYSALLGTVMYFYMLFQFFALESTSGSNTAFLSSSSFLLVPFLAAVFLGKKPTLGNALGLLVSAAGLLWMTGGVSGRFTNGDFYALISAILIAVHIVLVDKALGETTGGDRFEQTLAMGIMQMLFASLWALVGWRLVSPNSLALPLSSTVMLSVAGTGILCSAFCFTAQLIVQTKMNPTRFVLVLMLEPLFSLLYLMVIPINGVVERVGFGQLGGIFLVLSGMVISKSNPAKWTVKTNKKR